MLRTPVHSQLSLNGEDLSILAGISPSRRYDSQGVTIKVDRQWICVTADLRQPGREFLPGQLGKPGLWKCVSAEADRFRQVFEFPISAVSRAGACFDEPVQRPDSLLRAMLAWALATLDGSQMRDWHSPPLERLADVVSDQAFTVQCGAHARRGELIRKPQRLALRVPILHSIPPKLSVCRLEWLGRLLVDAQDRWRLVRVGIQTDTAGSRVLAEVDLSGAPEVVLKDLVRIALAALRQVVTWIIRAAVFVADPTTDAAALDLKRSCGRRGGVESQATPSERR